MTTETRNQTAAGHENIAVDMTIGDKIASLFAPVRSYKTRLAMCEARCAQLESALHAVMSENEALAAERILLESKVAALTKP